MWHANLTNIEQKLDQTNDRIEVTVEFYNNDSRTHIKKYMWYTDELADISIASSTEFELFMNRGKTI